MATRQDQRCSSMPDRSVVWRRPCEIRQREERKSLNPAGTLSFPWTTLSTRCEATFSRCTYAWPHLWPVADNRSNIYRDPDRHQRLNIYRPRTGRCSLFTRNAGTGWSLARELRIKPTSHRTDRCSKAFAKRTHLLRQKFRGFA